MEKPQPTQDIPLPIPNMENILGTGTFGVAHESLLDQGYIVKTYTSSNESVSIEEIYDTYKKQYVLLKSTFGEYIPDAVFTLSFESDDSNHKTIKVVQDRVFENEHTEETKLQLLDFINRSIDLYVSTYDLETKTGDAVDVHAENLLYGHTTSNPNPRLYFVDSGEPILRPSVHNYRKRLEYILTSYNLDIEPLQKLNKLD